MRRSQFLTAIVLVAALFTLVTGAQAQTRGTIQGYVVDGDETGIPGVGVTTVKVDTNATRTVFTNETGFFAARALAKFKGVGGVGVRGGSRSLADGVSGGFGGAGAALRALVTSHAVV